MASPGKILIAMMTDSFADVWQHLLADVGCDMGIVPAEDVKVLPAELTAAVLSAGGAEQEALEWLDVRHLPSRIPVFVVGADPGRRIAVQLMARGASDYFAMPEDIELLRNALLKVLARQREAVVHEQEAAVNTDAFRAIVGESPKLRTVVQRAARLVPYGRTTALIIGETGTGKELLARAIHDGGPRRTAAFVAVNCSALPGELIESELFGHERGAFTDAHAAKPGLFEVADGGTLFLDEVGTLALELQAKLLRVLEDGEVRRVGGTKVRKMDVRIIAATNEDLSEATERGTFRRDLYFRLGVVVLSLPPLREREEDVVLIADGLLRELAELYGLPEVRLGGDVRRALLAYSWPGNVRELKNAVERALLLSPPGTLDVSELVPHEVTPGPEAGPLPFPASLDEITSAAARAMVEWCGGNRSEAARRLNISRGRLRRFLEGV